jgi:hypothetical protein
MVSSLNNQQEVSAAATSSRRRTAQWKNSDAKALLVRLLSDETSYIHQLASVEEVYAAEPLFKCFPLKNFKTNFKNLKDSIKEEKDAIEFDQTALNSDKDKFPRSATTKSGNLFWDGHAAQRLMSEDVKAGRTVHMKPSVLQKERIEYQDFPLSILRQHKYQEEERKEREAVYWQKKRNDKARKKHEKERAGQMQQGQSDGATEASLS